MSRKLLTCSVILNVGSGILLLIAQIFGQPAIVFSLLKVGIVVGSIGTLAAWSIPKVLGQQRADGLFVGLLLSGVTIVALLLVGEFAVRFILKDITTTGDNLSYFAQRWKGGNVRLNSWGFRNPEFKMPKPDVTYRIAVIGDSFTFGQGIPEADRFTNLLKEYLNENAGSYKYEVVNFGKPGAETVDQIPILKKVLSSAGPDFILLQWYLNDVEGRNKSRQPKSATLLPSETLHAALHRRSAIYYLFNQEWSRLQNALQLSGSYTEYMLQRFGDPQTSDSKKSVQELREFIDLCKKAEIPLGIVLFPDIGPDLGDAYPFAYLHNRVLEICTDEGIVCIDLRSTIAPYTTDYKRLWVNRFDTHPGPLVNRLAAKRLMETFGPIWLSGAVTDTVASRLSRTGAKSIRTVQSLR